MVLGEKRWLFSIGNGAEIWPPEKGRKSSELLTMQECKRVGDIIRYSQITNSRHLG